MQHIAREPSLFFHVTPQPYAQFIINVCPIKMFELSYLQLLQLQKCVLYGFIAFSSQQAHFPFFYCKTNTFLFHTMRAQKRKNCVRLIEY